MSRSNHNYNNLCCRLRHDSPHEPVIGDDGCCWFHRGWIPGHKCYAERSWMSRRGIVHRSQRYQHNENYGKAPKWFRQELWAAVRAKYKADLFRYEGEEFGAHEKWMGGRIGWYW